MSDRYNRRLEMGFTSPLIREDRRLFAKAEQQKKRNPIGFIHFGEPEPEEEPSADECIVQMHSPEDFEDMIMHVITKEI
jgi:hypothetical protein